LPEKVLVTLADLDAPSFDRIRNVATSMNVSWIPCRGAAALTAALSPDVTIALMDGLPATMSSGSALHWIQLASSGVDGYLGSPAWANSAITITNARGVAAPAIAEYIIAMMLQDCHRLLEAESVKASRSWPDEYDALEATLLFGQTLVIVGFGSVGRRTAAIAHQLGMHVIGVRSGGDRARSDLDWRLSEVRDLDSATPRITLTEVSQLEDALRVADYVVVALPKTAETVGLLGAEAFAAMKATALVINIARGGIVDEAALAQALVTRKIRAAVLDVFSTEPPPVDSPLYEIDEVVMTPHIAGYHKGYMATVARLFCENLERFQDGLPLLNRVDRRRGY
jgi:phosphoglycerate dehydrogenase-like enzyme